MNLDYNKIAEKHDVSVSVVQHLAKAITLGHGNQAQFNHPELGGMGQWMPSMMMISDMFNYKLKAKVDELCHELAQAYHDGNLTATPSTKPMQTRQWWSGNYQHPSIVGGQNNLRYAYFVDKYHLIIQDGNQEIVYDTRPYHLIGVSQQQSNTVTQLVFHTQDGQTLTLKDFKQVTQ